MAEQLERTRGRWRAAWRWTAAVGLCACGGAAPAPERGDTAGEPVASERREAAADAPLRVGGTGVDFVASKLREQHGVHGEGRAPVTDVLRARLETSVAESFPVRLEGGRCYVVLAVGVPSVRNLELSLLDEFGTTRATDDVEDAFPRARMCPRVDADWTVRLRVFEGYGAVGAQVFGGPS